MKTNQILFYVSLIFCVLSSAHDVFADDPVVIYLDTGCDGNGLGPSDIPTEVEPGSLIQLMFYWDFPIYPVSAGIALYDFEGTLIDEAKVTGFVDLGGGEFSLEYQLPAGVACEDCSLNVKVLGLMTAKKEHSQAYCYTGLSTIIGNPGFGGEDFSSINNDHDDDTVGAGVNPSVGGCSLDGSANSDSLWILLGAFIALYFLRRRSGKSWKFS